MNVKIVKSVIFDKLGGISNAAYTMKRWLGGSPPSGTLKIKVDRVERGKLDPLRTGGVSVMRKG